MRPKSRTGMFRKEDGAAAVEFALVSTVLFLLLFGIIEFGQAYSQYQVFQGAAREGGRVAAVAAGSVPALTTTNVKDRVEDAAEPFEVSPPITVSVDGTPGTCTDATRGDHVTVKWRQIFDIQLPFVPPLDTRIWISAVFRCE